MSTSKGQNVLLVLLVIASLGTTLLVCLSVLLGPSAASRPSAMDMDVDTSAAAPAAGATGAVDTATLLRGGEIRPATQSEPRVLGTLPQFNLVNENDDNFGSAQLQGQVWVADFIFTRCAGPCPMMTSRMAELQLYLLQEQMLNTVRLVTFTVDPTFDTPAVLAQRAKAARIHPQGWDWVTGARDQIWQLIRDGFKLPVEDMPSNIAMPIMHSQKFVLVDRQLRVRGYYDVLTDDGMNLLKRDLHRILREPAPGSEPAAAARP